MTQVNIYRGEQLIESLVLEPAPLNDFFVFENPEIGIFWESGDYARKNLRKRLAGQKVWGGMLITCLHGRVIEWVPHNWDLWTNGKRWEKKFYRRVVIKWAKVELGYQIYRFEFLFPEFEGTDFPLPE